MSLYRILRKPLQLSDGLQSTPTPFPTASCRFVMHSTSSPKSWTSYRSISSKRTTRRVILLKNSNRSIRFFMKCTFSARGYASLSNRFKHPYSRPTSSLPPHALAPASAACRRSRSTRATGPLRPSRGTVCNPA